MSIKENGIDVSVIIPIYNSEKYLRECIDSVLLQEEVDLEIILVDDGSKDASWTICEEYKNKYDCVKAIHKENGGASSARNLGLIYAKGEYICFVDSDDKLQDNSLINLRSCITSNNSDFCAVAPVTICRKDVIKIERDKEDFLSYIVSSNSYYPWGKMYRFDIIKNNNLYFDETMECSEDALFIRQYLAYCDSICFIRKEIYEYRRESEGLSKKTHQLFDEYYIKKLGALECLLAKRGYPQDLVDVFISERAVHGLRISIEHFAAKIRESDVVLDKIKNAVLLFSPWIRTERLNNGKLKIWLLLNRRAIHNCNSKILLRRAIAILRINQIAKRIIGR